MAVPAHVEGSSAATSRQRRNHPEFECTDLAKKAKAFNLTMTNLSASTLLCESRLSIHCIVLLPMHYSVGRSFPCSSFWIRAGPKRFLAPRKCFSSLWSLVQHVPIASENSVQREPKGLVCVQLCSEEPDSMMQGHVAFMSYHMQ